MDDWLDKIDPNRHEIILGLIPEQYQGADISDFVGDDAAVAAEVFDLCDPALKNHVLVTVSGPTGTGKTRLAYAVLQMAWRRHRVNVQMEQCSELVTKIRMAQYGDQGLSYTINSIAEWGRVQILDDFGAGSPNPREWAFLQSIVERREHFGLKTLVITNLTAAELQVVDARLASRIGGGLWLEMTGADRRAD